jgi:hypothetical protein
MAGVEEKKAGGRGQRAEGFVRQEIQVLSNTQHLEAVFPSASCHMPSLHSQCPIFSQVTSLTQYSIPISLDRFLRLLGQK